MRIVWSSYMEVLDDQPQTRQDEGELARGLYKFDFSSKSSNLDPPLSRCSWFLDRALIAALNRNAGCGLCGLAAPTSIVFISPLQIISAFFSNQHPDNLRYFQLSGRHVQLVNMTKLKCPKLRMTSTDCQMTINLKCTSWPLKDGGGSQGGGGQWQSGQ